MVSDLQLKRAKATLRSMMRTRGYKYMRRCADSPQRVYRATKDQVQRGVMIIFCVSDPKIGVKALRDIQERFTEEDHILVIYHVSMTSFAKQHLEKIVAGGTIVESFSIGQLQFDIMCHVLVPPHKEVSVRCIRKLGVTPEQLPVILDTDPVVRYFRWPRGTIVRVTLANPEGHEYYDYRVVA
jgi:DNA-directed RNA polymerase subunit H (RpoH/RPB5)